jgi:hypothetical protein
MIVGGSTSKVDTSPIAVRLCDFCPLVHYVNQLYVHSTACSFFLCGFEQHLCSIANKIQLDRNVDPSLYIACQYDIGCAVVKYFVAPPPIIFTVMSSSECVCMRTILLLILSVKCLCSVM